MYKYQIKINITVFKMLPFSLLFHYFWRIGFDLRSVIFQSVTDLSIWIIFAEESRRDEEPASVTVTVRQPYQTSCSSDIDNNATTDRDRFAFFTETYFSREMAGGRSFLRFDWGGRKKLWKKLVVSELVVHVNKLHSLSSFFTIQLVRVNMLDSYL